VIELNLLEKKQPLKLPVVMGVDLNEMNLVMIVVAIIIYYVPGMFVDSYIEGKNKEIVTQIEEIKSKNDELKNEIGKNTQTREMLKAYQDQLDKLKSRSSQVDEILKIRTNPKKILEKIARSLSEDLWFETLVINAKNEIIITGGAYNSRSLGEFITLMNDTPYLGGSLTPTKQENKQDQLDGVLTNYDIYELHGKIKNFDMRAN
jgi:hypothetical protein